MDGRTRRAGGWAFWLTGALVAVALMPIAASAGAEYEELAGVNAALNRARQLLPTEVGGSVRGEAEAVTRLTTAVEAARAALSDRLKAVEPDAYAEVRANLADVEAWLAHLRLSHACNVARQQILLAHNGGQRAGDEAFATFASAITALAAGGHAGAGDDTAFYRAQLDKLRGADAEVEAIAKERARRARVQTALVVARERLLTLAQANAAGQPITGEALAALEQATATLATDDATAAQFFSDERSFYRLEQLWAKGSPEAETAIAAELGGAIAAKGKARAKSITLKIKAKAGKCYVVLSRLDEASGGEAIDTVDWAVAPKSAVVNELAVRRGDGWKGLASYGFCPGTNATVTGKLTLNARPKKNWRYVAVEVAREAFPRALAMRLEILPGDYCDPKVWEQLWLQPTPGTVAYRDKQPVLIRRAGSDGTAEVWTAADPKSTTLAVTALASTPPAALELTPDASGLACPNDADRGRAKAAISRKVLQCHSAIDKKVKARAKKVDAMRAALAKKGEPATAADEMAAKLKEDEAAERAKKCAPLEQQAAETFTLSYKVLRQQLMERRYQDPIQRADGLRAYPGVAEPAM